MMKLVVERHGGFAGLKRRGERDGASLSPEQHDALRKVMEAPPAAPDPGADRFSYRLEVHDEAGARTVQVPESVMPASLAAIATEKGTASA
jgi:hypothetical protein